MGAQLVIDKFLYSAVGVLTVYSNRLFISVAQDENISRKVYGLIWFCGKVFSCSRDKERILIRANLCISWILAGMCQVEINDRWVGFWDRNLLFA